MLYSKIIQLFKKTDLQFPQDIHILYGSHSGNSSYIARETQKYFQKNGLRCSISNMAKYNVKQLIHEKNVLLVLSTHGEGDPPASARRFYNHLLSAEAPRLHHLKYSVCALGDSSYKHFCKTGRDIDLRLEELGASRFVHRVDCDVDFQQPASQWITETFSFLTKKESTSAIVPLSSSPPQSDLQAIVKHKQQLNPGSETPIFHIELTMTNGECNYQPGDSISIIPKNNSSIVDAIMQKLAISDRTRVTDKPDRQQQYKLLRNHLELNRLNRKLLQNYHLLNPESRMEDLLHDEVKLENYLLRHDVLDLLYDFPYQGKTDDFFSLLNPVQPRYYSISSSVLKHPGEVHLTVKQIQTKINSRTRQGMGSSYLNMELREGETVSFQLIPNHQFRLPPSPHPLILIANGTGIAPFRAFLQELSCRKHFPKSWLFFGEKKQEYDFLYHREWHQWLSLQLLNRINTAFSRDQTQKIYLQHRIEEQASEFFRWLEKGAHVYICGSIEMRNEVKKSILKILQSAGKQTETEAQQYFKQLLHCERLHEDVY